MPAYVFVSWSDKSRQPEGTLVSSHREKIRQLMLEKEHPSIIATPADIPPTPTNPHNPSRSSTTPPKRYEIAKAAKKTAIGAGIGLVVVFAAALFPISAPLYFIRRRRQKMMMYHNQYTMDDHWVPASEMRYHSVSMPA